MSARKRASGSLHLLEFGLHWPPETFLLQKIEQLATRGFAVTVATSEDDSGLGVEVPGVDVVRAVPMLRAGSLLAGLRSWVALFFRKPRRAAKVAFAAARPTAAGRVVGPREALHRLASYARLATLEPDVVHFEWTLAAVQFSTLLDALGCPAVLSCRGLDVNAYPHTPRTQRMARGLPTMFSKAAAVHCISAAIEREAQSLGLERAKSHLIVGGVDPDLFRPPSVPRSPQGSFRVVSVANLRWVKGWEYALHAVALLVGEGIPVSLEIVGGDPPAEAEEPSERKRIIYTVDDLGLKGRVRLHGHLQPERVRDQLQRADAFLLTSLSEGMPSAVLEAMACGLPVVSTDVGGIGEAVRDRVDGLLCPSRDARSAAAALRELWEDPGLRERLGAAGRARVLSDFTAERETDAWVELYRQVAGLSRRQPTHIEPRTPSPERMPDGDAVLSGDGATLRVLGVGPLSWESGYEYALQAVRLLLDRGISSEYRIIGSGEHGDAISFARHELGLQRLVSIVPPREEALQEHLRWADVLLDSSVAPTQGALAPEGSALGLPIVTTQRSVEEALVVPRRDPEAIAEKLARFVRE